MFYDFMMVISLEDPSFLSQEYPEMQIMVVIASWPAIVTWVMIWGYLADYDCTVIWECVLIELFTLQVFRS